MRVLLLESDPEVRSWLGGLIAARGHLVSSHSSNEGALAALAGADYPLIVLGLDGAEGDRLVLVRRLRSLPEGDRHVILAVAGEPGQGDLFAAIEAGVDDVLHDPRDLEQCAIRLAIAERRVEVLTERTHQDAGRRDGERLLRALFGLAQDGLLLADDTGRIVEINLAALDLLGAEDHAALATIRLPDLLSLGRRDEAAERWQILLREGSLTGEYRRTLSDGFECTVEYRLAGNVVPGRHLGLLRDVTADRQADETLRVSEERFRGVIEIIRDGLIVVDAVGRIVYANAAVERTLGMDRDALIGHVSPHPAWTMFGPDGAKLGPDELPLNLAINEGATLRDLDLVGVRADGLRLRLRISVAPLRGHDGRIAGAVGSFRAVDSDSTPG